MLFRSILCAHLCAAQMPETRGESGSSGQLISSNYPQPESVVPGAGGYFVSAMPVPSPPAPAPVPGTVAKYNMDGTRDQTFTPISGFGGTNAGLAISSNDVKLYVTSGGSVVEYDLSASGATVSQTFDLSAHTASTNGLCLSHDDAFLYVTEPGMALNPMGGVAPTPAPSALLVITVATGAVESLFTGSADHSPNGCFVSPDDPNLVHMINFQHGVTAWNKNSGVAAVTWGSDLQAIQQTEGDVRAGDGLVHYNGMWYVSLWKIQMDMSTGAPVASGVGTIYSCATSSTTCSVFVADLAGADLQLDLRDASRPILISPDLLAMSVVGIELPLPSTTTTTTSGGSSDSTESSAGDATSGGSTSDGSTSATNGTTSSSAAPGALPSLGNLADAAVVMLPFFAIMGLQ